MGMRYFKCTGPNGRSWYDDDVQYVVGQTLEHPNPDMSPAECGRGFHCSPHIHQVVKYAKEIKRAEFFEVEIETDDVLGKDSDKVRVRRLSVIRQLSEADFWIVRGSLVDVLSYGYGDGYGDGSGYGDGYGDGSGYGYGSGSGSGSGSGYGYGYGDGSGYGYGDGSGYGYGDGSGYGSGSGYGYGSGYGDGDGSGYGSGSGYGDGVSGLRRA